MKTFASLVLLFCMTSATLCAQETIPSVDTGTSQAKIVLVCPDSCRVGELVRLDVSESTADSFMWKLVPDSVDFEVYAEGRRAVFSARAPGEYRFIVACAKDGTVDVVHKLITVIGPPPQPIDNSLAQWIPFWLWNYDLPDNERLALADSFHSVAAREAELKTAEDWIKATAESNREALGDSLDAWSPMLDKIGTVLLKMAQDGKLLTPEQHATVWKEIAAGLREG